MRGLTDLGEIGLAAGEVAPVIARTGLPLAPLPMAFEKLAVMRSERRALARHSIVKASQFERFAASIPERSRLLGTQHRLTARRACCETPACIMTP